MKKISVITPSYNSVSTIADCILSVAQQDYPDFEQILVDGLSTDDTLYKATNLNVNQLRTISERDSGIYEAINKGVRNSKGEILLLLMSDDFLADKNVFKEVGEAFSDPAISVVYGDIKIVDQTNLPKVKRYWRSGYFKDRKVKYGRMPPTPAVFFRKSHFDFENGFDNKFQISGDYDFFIRNRNTFRNAVYLDRVITIMRAGGVSNRSVKKIVQKWSEDYQIVKNHNVGGILTIFFKTVIKLKQFYSAQK